MEKYITNKFFLQFIEECYSNNKSSYSIDDNRNDHIENAYNSIIDRRIIYSKNFKNKSYSKYSKPNFKNKSSYSSTKTKKIQKQSHLEQLLKQSNIHIFGFCENLNGVSKEPKT